MSDLVALHDYEELGKVLAERYCDKEKLTGGRMAFNRERCAMAKGYAYKGQPILISEYGVIAFQTEEGWGYGNQVADERIFLGRFCSITTAIKALPYVVGFCYTQVTDVQQKVNGLCTIQRELKVHLRFVSCCIWLYNESVCSRKGMDEYGFFKNSGQSGLSGRYR